jgi:hypothetical protein
VCALNSTRSEQGQAAGWCERSKVRSSPVKYGAVVLQLSGYQRMIQFNAVSSLSEDTVTGEYFIL